MGGNLAAIRTGIKHRCGPLLSGWAFWQDIAAPIAHPMVCHT